MLSHSYVIGDILERIKIIVLQTLEQFGCQFRAHSSSVTHPGQFTMDLAFNVFGAQVSFGLSASAITFNVTGDQSRWSLSIAYLNTPNYSLSFNMNFYGINLDINYPNNV